MKTLTSSKTFFKSACESRHVGLYNGERIRSLALSVEIRQPSTFVPILLYQALFKQNTLLKLICIWLVLFEI